MRDDESPGRPDLVPGLKQLRLDELSVYCSVVLSLRAGRELTPLPYALLCDDCGAPLFEPRRKLCDDCGRERTRVRKQTKRQHDRSAASTSVS